MFSQNNTAEKKVEQTFTADLMALRAKAHAGDAEAQYNWAHAYHTGKGMVQDLSKAIYWYTLASNQEYRWAQFNLAWIYQYSCNPQQMQQAIFWYQKAVANGSTRAREELKKLGIAPVDALRPPIIPYQELTKGEMLGRGHFGVVYKAKYGLEDVAIKELILQAGKGLDDNLLTNFEREVSILEKLRSQYVISIRGICIQPACMVLEFMPGGSLHAALQSNVEMDWSKKLTMAEDIGKGLSYLHSQNPVVLHRDLKSENVLLDMNGHAKLGDFGLAKLKHTTQVNTGAVGTLSHIAPELFNATPDHNEACDVYSYGIILCELATRKKPYEGVHPYHISSKVVKGERPLFEPEKTIPATPATYANLVLHAWAQNPAKRAKLPEILNTLGEQKKKLG